MNPQACSLFLQARALSDQTTKAGYQQSETLYERVLDIEPIYAAAVMYKLAREPTVSKRQLGAALLRQGTNEAALEAMRLERDEDERLLGPAMVYHQVRRETAAVQCGTRRVREPTGCGLRRPARCAPQSSVPSHR